MKLLEIPSGWYVAPETSDEAARLRQALVTLAGVSPPAAELVPVPNTYRDRFAVVVGGKKVAELQMKQLRDSVQWKACIGGDGL